MKKQRTQANKKRKVSFRTRLLLMIIGPLLVLGAAMTMIGHAKLTDISEKGMQSNLITYTESTLKRYEALNDEKFTYDMKHGLMKGDVIISGNTEILDALKESTGLDATVYYKNIRIATTVKDADGARMVGTKADEVIATKVLENGESVFLNELNVGGVPYCAYYTPIHQTGSDEIIGMIFAGEIKTDANKLINKALMSIYAMLIVVIFLCVLEVVWLSGLMTKAIQYSKKEINKLANGELRFEENRKILDRTDDIGELGRTTQYVVEQISVIVNDIISTSQIIEEFANNFVESFHNINENTSEIDTAVTEIAKGATSQAIETQDANTKVVDMGAAIDNVSSKVENLNRSSKKMSEYNNSVNTTLKDLEEISERTKDSVGILYDQTTATNLSAKEIRETTNLITNIAEQTNLLSLNASIEAARAGDMGKGFAVVAEEIRLLSLQSGEAADKIIHVVDNLLDNSDRSVNAMDHMSNEMKEQTTIIDETHSVFESLNNEVSDVTLLIEAIGAEIHAIEDIKTDVLNIVENLAAIAEENAASTEETSAGVNQLQFLIDECNSVTEQMAELSVELKNSTNKFSF